jgi:hypothetical protein
METFDSFFPKNGNAFGAVAPVLETTAAATQDVVRQFTDDAFSMHHPTQQLSSHFSNGQQLIKEASDSTSSLNWKYIACIAFAIVLLIGGVVYFASREKQSVTTKHLLHAPDSKLLDSFSLPSLPRYGDMKDVLKFNGRDFLQGGESDEADAEVHQQQIVQTDERKAHLTVVQPKSFHAARDGPSSIPQAPQAAQSREDIARQAGSAIKDALLTIPNITPPDIATIVTFAIKTLLSPSTVSHGSHVSQGSSSVATTVNHSVKNFPKPILPVLQPKAVLVSPSPHSHASHSTGGSFKLQKNMALPKSKVDPDDGIQSNDEPRDIKINVENNAAILQMMKSRGLKTT